LKKIDYSKKIHKLIPVFGPTHIENRVKDFCTVPKMDNIKIKTKQSMSSIDSDEEGLNPG
jgi:hypothetical protein